MYLKIHSFITSQFTTQNVNIVYRFFNIWLKITTHHLHSIFRYNIYDEINFFLFVFFFQSSRDTDLVFDDLQSTNLDDSPIKTLTNNRNRIDDEDEEFDAIMDEDVRDVLSEDDNLSSDHWIMKSVKRMKRGLDKLFGAGKFWIIVGFYWFINVFI